MKSLQKRSQNIEIQPAGDNAFSNLVWYAGIWDVVMYAIETSNITVD